MTALGGHIHHAPAAMKPRARNVYIVSWVGGGGVVTRRRYFLVKSYAERFRNRLLTYGREAEMYETVATWCEVKP